MSMLVTELGYILLLWLPLAALLFSLFRVSKWGQSSLLTLGLAVVIC